MEKKFTENKCASLTDTVSVRTTVLSVLLCVLVCQACRNKLLQTEWLTQWKLIFF